MLVRFEPRQPWAKGATDCGHPITELNSYRVANWHDGYHRHDSSPGRKSAPHRESLSNKFQLDHARTVCWWDATWAIGKRNCILEAGSRRILARANKAPCNLHKPKLGEDLLRCGQSGSNLFLCMLQRFEEQKAGLGRKRNLGIQISHIHGCPAKTRKVCFHGHTQLDGDLRSLLWLGPKSVDDTSTMVLRHWLMTKLVPTFPLPGILFFDAWRIRPSLTIPLQLLAGLTAVDLTHGEEIPQQPEAQDTTHVDRLLQRQEVLTARADAKTAADCAVQVSYVMQLTAALLEAGRIIEESTREANESGLVWCLGFWLPFWGPKLLLFLRRPCRPSWSIWWPCGRTCVFK